VNITVIGTGYVGLVVGACLAETGNPVVCADLDRAKIEGLQQNVLPIYEPGLDDYVARNQSQGRLRFTTDVSNAISPSGLRRTRTARRISGTCSPSRSRSGST
jgi:UDPglucose 6-dehydrogenase